MPIVEALEGNTPNTIKEMINPTVKTMLFFISFNFTIFLSPFYICYTFLICQELPPLSNVSSITDVANQTGATAKGTRQRQLDGNGEFSDPLLKNQAYSGKDCNQTYRNDTAFARIVCGYPPRSYRDAIN
jgi:hypothetical protein